MIDRTAKDPIYKEIFKRLEVNREISLRPFSQLFEPKIDGGSDLFYDYLLSGKLVMLELDFIAKLSGVQGV